MLKYIRTIGAVNVEVSEDLQRVHVHYDGTQRVVDDATGEQFGAVQVTGVVVDSSTPDDPIYVAAMALAQAVIDREIAADPTGAIAQKASSRLATASASPPTTPSVA